MKAEETYHERFKELKKTLGLNANDIGKSIGHTADSVRTMTKRAAVFPKWAKFGLFIFEKMQNDIKKLECKLEDNRLKNIDDECK